MKDKGTRIAKLILKKKNKVRAISLPSFTTYYTMQQNREPTQMYPTDFVKFFKIKCT